jgi:small multidrug resistance pump
MQGWILVLAILAEVLATSALKASNGFTRPIPSLLVIIGYIVFIAYP